MNHLNQPDRQQLASPPGRQMGRSSLALGLLVVLALITAAMRPTAPVEIAIALQAEDGKTFLPMIAGSGTPTNQPPVATDDSYQTIENGQLVLDAADGVLINDTDPEQAPLQAQLVTGPAHGVLALNADGSFTYTPAAGFFGQDSFTYQATDGTHVSNVANVTLIVAEEGDPPPTANDDLYETLRDTALVVGAAAGLLANDEDPVQAPLQAVLIGGPAHGTLTLNSDGSFTYTPDAAFVGPDSFTYQATNGTTTSNTATVTLNVLDPDANVGPHFATGKNDFTKKVIDTKVSQVHSVNGADLDGDGDIDLVATDYVNGAVNWYANDGHGDFVLNVLDDNLPGAYPSHVGDVDGDGDADVLAGGYQADTFAWYRNDGGGNFTRINIDTRTDGAHSIITSDLDEDGDVDLVTSSQDAGTIAWYRNNGANVFQRVIIDRTALGAKRAEVADIDSDGDLDIAIASYDNDQVAWLQNDGQENFTKHVLPGKRDGAYYATPADVDGDGDVDILTASKLDNTIALYRNDGAQNFTEELLDRRAIGARSVIAADLDRDGDLDPISTSREDATIAWFVNDGSGHFTWRAIDRRADGAYGVEALDVDGDGDMDVLSASRHAGEVAVHTRTHSHVATLTAGEMLVIQTAMLQAVDLNDGPAELTYTLTNAPDYGELRLDDVALADGATFTQADIDSGRLSYVHHGTLESADAFFFTVADGGEDGAQPIAGGFQLNIDRPLE